MDSLTCAAAFCTYGVTNLSEGKARKGPTFREAVLLHAAARLVLHPQIQNIQTLKMGPEVKHCLNAGVNDLEEL